MIQIAHASRLEAMKGRIKAMKKQRKKAKYLRNQKLAEMTPEERKEFLANENPINYKNLYTTSLWDFNHNQLPITKYDLVISYCENYLLELEEQEQTPFIIRKIDEVKKFKKRLER